MQDGLIPDKLFGEISIDRKLISKEGLERALVIQRCIFSRSKVTTPIGKVLQKMGLLTEVQVQSILAEQGSRSDSDSAQGAAAAASDPVSIRLSDVFTLSVSEDNVIAHIIPTGADHKGISADDIKRLLFESGLTHGIVSDSLLRIYLEKTSLPKHPFKVAAGSPAVVGHAPEIRYHFDTDPMRIGTVQEDGTMDWKNRGEIPQVAAGEVLAEKVGGDPGSSGKDVYGHEIIPPKLKEPQLKSSKGAQKSEDGRQVLAKISGTPKIEADGRIAVYSILPVKGDIGMETGNINFDGHIEVNGAVTDGYSVKGKSVTANEIQNATVEISEDLITHSGIYGSTLRVGGNIKASHLHNCTIEVTGDLVVEKEIFGCNAEVNGQVLIVGGKIIASKIGAKKGILTKDVGTSAARASELIVGVDFKCEREMKMLKEGLVVLEAQKSETEKSIVKSKERIDRLDEELGTVAQEQDRVMVQRRQMEARLDTPTIKDNPEKAKLVSGLVRELSEKYNELDQRVRTIMDQDEQLRTLLGDLVTRHQVATEHIEKTKQDMILLEETAAIDPGTPIVKARGTIYSKSIVVGPHKQMHIEEDLKQVKIYEYQDDNKQFLMKIASL